MQSCPKTQITPAGEFFVNNLFFNRVAVVTSKQSWFLPYAEQFVQQLINLGANSSFFTRYEDINNSPQVVFLLSYFSLVKAEELEKYKLNFVVHESNLPNGKGWAPVFWQVLENKNEIPIVLFEAVEEMDAGPIYIKDIIILDGSELHDEIRDITAMKTIAMCTRLLQEYSAIKPKSQIGKSSYYPKRTPADSELDINKPLSKLFNQLRVASNDLYPAFFYYRGIKYVLRITKQNDAGLSD